MADLAQIEITAKDSATPVINATRDSVERLSGSTQKLAMEANNAASTADKMQQANERLRQTLVGVGLALGARELAAYADMWANIQGRLNLVTNSTAEMTRVQGQLFEVAQRSRISFESTADIYTKLARSATTLGGSQKDLLRVTETISKSMIISGASADSQKAALMQLGQAFSSGVLRGEELNSVMEQSPRLAQAIADGLGVTIGQLREMGKEGKLTAEAVFGALKGQGAALDAEFSKMPKTIEQAMTMMKNAVLQHIGVMDQENQISAKFAEVLATVANHIDLVFTALGVLTNVKIAMWITAAANGFVLKSEKAAIATAAINAERAATMASLTANAAHADAVAINARVLLTQAEASVAASTGMARLAAVQTALIPAQTAHTVAVEANIVAQTALATATTGAATAASFASRAIGFLGGPLGAILTVLTAGISIWQLWGAAAKDNEKKVTNAVELSTADVLADLDKQIKKLEERNRLVDLGIPTAKGDSKSSERMASLMTEIHDAKWGTGKFDNVPMLGRQTVLATLGKEYASLTEKIAIFNQKTEIDENNKSGKKYGDWMKTYATNAEKLTVELDKAKKELGSAFTPELEARIRKQFEEKTKGAAKGANDAYRVSITEEQAIYKQQEIATKAHLDSLANLHKNAQLGDIEFAQLSYAAELANLGRKKQLMMQEEEIASKATGKSPDAAKYRAQMAEVDAQILARSAKLGDDLLTIQSASNAALAKSQIDDLKLRGATASAYMLEFQTKNAAAMNKALRDSVSSGDLSLVNALLKEFQDGVNNADFGDLKNKITDAMATMQAEIARVNEVAAADGGWVAKFNADLGAQEIRNRALPAIREMSAELSQLADKSGNINLSRTATDVQRQVTTASNQMSAGYASMMRTVDTTFHDAFIAMLEKGEDSWKSFTKGLVRTFKSTVADAIYQMFVRPLVLNLVAQGGGALGLSGGAAGGGTSILSAASTGKSIYDLGGGGGFGGAYDTFARSSAGQSLGLSEAGYSVAEGIPTSTMTPMGQTIGSNAGAIAGGVAAGYSAYTVGEKYGAVGGMAAGVGTIAATGALTGVVGGTGAMAGAGAALAAVPVWGWVALGALAILGGMQDGPEENTILKFGSNNKAGNTSNNQRGPEGNPGAYIDGSGQGAFGTFGVTETLWMDARQPVVQDFIKNVTATDTALAQYLSKSETDSVTNALTNQTSIAHTGPEGSNPNGTGQLDQVFKERIVTIFDGVEAGMSSVISGFVGSSAQLAAEAQTLLAVRKNIAGYTALFGQDVTLQSLATDLEQFKKEGESTGAVITRMAMTFDATNRVASLMGADTSSAFGAVGLASSKARENLIEVAGGFDQLAAKLDFYYANFFSEGEQKAKSQADAQGKVNAVFDDWNKTHKDFQVAAPKSKAEFRALTEAVFSHIKDGGEIGAGAADAWNRLQSIAPAFIASLDDAADATARQEEKMAALKEKAGAAYNAAAAAIQAGLDRISASISKYRGLADSLKSTLDAVSPMARAEAQAQIGAALAIAKAGGRVPEASDIAQALDVLKQPSQNLFGNFLDYQRDFQMTANTINDAYTAAKGQLTLEEQAFKALTDQGILLKKTYDDEMARLDAINSTGQKQIDSIDAVKTEVSTVNQSIKDLQETLNPVKKTASVGAKNDAVLNEQWSGGKWQSIYGASYDTATGNITDKSGNGITNALADRAWAQQQIENGNTGAVFTQAVNMGISPRSADELLGLPAGTSQSWIDANVSGYMSNNQPGVLKIDGSHAGGLNSVPFDGYIAELHEGERVLTAQETREMDAPDSPSVRPASSGNAEVVSALNQVRIELQGLRREAQLGDVQVITSLNKAVRMLDRIDVTGVLTRPAVVAA